MVLCQIGSKGVKGNCSAESHGGKDGSTGLSAKHSLDHTAHAVRTVSGAQATPPQQKQSVTTGNRQVPRCARMCLSFPPIQKALVWRRFRPCPAQTERQKKGTALCVLPTLIPRINSTTARNLTRIPGPVHPATCTTG